MKNVRKHRNIKLVTTDKKRGSLSSEPNYHTTKWFSEGLLSIEWKIKKIKNWKLKKGKMNKPTYLGLSTLETSKNINV